MPIRRQFDIAKVDLRAIHLMWLVTLKGHEIRLCGGAVRDLLRGIAPKDWDMATTAHPETVMKIMQDEGITVIPTGLQHGTVTAVFEGENFEITTLRVDAETDGRHAVVQYTDDWQLDANRRDFTMNALYLDADGMIHDYVNGVPDLQENQVRFVGNAEDRIREDYLRILRYFRFKARIIKSASDDFVWEDGVYDAIVKHRDGLCQISGERIWMEMKKIIQCKEGAFPATSAMFETCVLDSIGLGKMAKRNHFLKPTLRIDERPTVLLAACHHKQDLDDLHAYMCDGLKMSRAETRPVEFYLANANRELLRENALRLMVDNSKEDVLAWVAITEGGRHEVIDTINVQHGRKRNIVTKTDTKLYDAIAQIEVPDFPVTGKDLIDIGVKPGPEMGKIIRQLKDVWTNLEFVPDKHYLLNLVYRTNGVINE